MFALRRDSHGPDSIVGDPIAVFSDVAKGYQIDKPPKPARFHIACPSLASFGSPYVFTARYSHPWSARSAHTHKSRECTDRSTGCALALGRTFAGSKTHLES